MKNKSKPLLKGAVLTTLITLSAPGSALDKPQTMEDMWKIIQAQQKQIDEMKAGMSSASSKAVTAMWKNRQIKLLPAMCKTRRTKSQPAMCRTQRTKSQIAM